jgi:hypothetical protein
MNQLPKSLAIVLSLCLCSRAAMAETVDFTFTGTGINGTAAIGAFSIDSAAIGPDSYGQISQFAPIFNFSLTVANFPEGDPSPLVFDAVGSNVFFGMDNGGVPRIIPGAVFNFPASFYQLTADTDFYAPPFTPYYHSVLDYVSFSRVHQDDIVWSQAIPVIAVPEPASAALLGLGAVVVAAVFLRQRALRAHSR